MPRFLATVSVDGDQVRQYTVAAQDDTHAACIAREHFDDLITVNATPITLEDRPDADLDYDLAEPA